MRSVLTNMIGLIFFCCISNVVVAQFNTVRYYMDASNKATENVLQEDITKERKTKSIKKKKGFWRNLFTNDSKANLKLKVDSLQNVILRIEREHKVKIEQIQKSLDITIKSEISKIKKAEKERHTVRVHMPLDIMFITSPFGYRKCEKNETKKFHYGIDLRANYNQVYAIMDGVIEDVGVGKNEGKYIKIAHSDKIKTIYLHLSEVYYKKGDKVKSGFIIAKSGNTGKSTNPHLHFAVKENDKYINPMVFLNKIVEINHVIKLNQDGKK